MLVMASGCLSPAARIDHRAGRLGLKRQVVAGSGFQHVYYLKEERSADGWMHVYLEGDGLPWASPTEVSADPTPRRTYALELMLLDPATSAYVGRPCYHGLNHETPCQPKLWTHQRYSPAVVESLEAAIRAIAAQSAARHLVLVGYSGGGVLAMLLAERLEATRAVVTIAANLDTEAWTMLHGFSPLAGSLNPARRPPLAAGILQVHLAGGRDDKTPAKIIAAVAERQPASELRFFPEFDHTCCWQQIWPEILDELGRDLGRQLPEATSAQE